MVDLDNVRVQIVKELIDQFPKVRAFVRGYLKVYYPKKRKKGK